MARTRIIKPKLAKNERLADIGPHAQFLFAMLPTLADREGRLEDRPRFIKAEVFPYYDVDVDALLGSLASRSGLAEDDEPFIRRYGVNGRRFIEIVKFEQHQSPHHKEESSQIPPPSEDSDGSSNVEPSTPLACFKHNSSAHQTEVKPQYKQQVTSKRGSGGKRFVPPTAADVAAYCAERKNRVDPQQFVDHYESNGWRVGKNSMRDWQAAVRTWEKNGIESRGSPAAESEYREVSFVVFSAHRDDGDFLVTPRVERLENNRVRVFGQLKSKRKIQAFADASELSRSSAKEPQP